MMKTNLLFIFLMVGLQGCIGLLIGPTLTNKYVHRTARSFSAFENENISELRVDVNGKGTTTKELRGKVLLVSRLGTDSLINEVNRRRIKYDLNSDTIMLVRYMPENADGGDKGNPFLNKKIVNALIDKNGKVVGTNIRKVPKDDECSYYLDYALYRMNEGVTLHDSFIDYRWGVIFFYKWPKPKPENRSTFDHWFIDQMDKGILKYGDR